MDFPTITLVLGFLCVVGLAGLILWVEGRLDVLSPAWWLLGAYFVSFTLRPLYLWQYGGYGFFRYDYDRLLVLEVVSWATFGAFLCGFYRRRSVIGWLIPDWLDHRVEAIAHMRSGWLLRYHRVLFLGCVIASGYIVVSLLAHVGWPTQWDTTGLLVYLTRVRSAMLGDITAKGHLYYLGHGLLKFFPALFYVAHRSYGLHRRWWMLALMAGITYNAFVMERLAVAICVLTVALAKFYYDWPVRGRMSWRHVALIVMVVAFVFVIGSVVGSLRRGSPQVDVLFVAASFDAIDFLSRAVERSLREGYLFGRSLVESVGLTFLPRAVFPWKPEIYGAVRLQHELAPFFYEQRSLEATWPVGMLAEGYLNFYWVGVAIMPYLVGAVLGKMYQRALERRSLMMCLLWLMYTVSVLSWFRDVGQVIAELIMIQVVLFVIPVAAATLFTVSHVGVRTAFVQADA
jgi:hypothetical protein